MASSFTNRVKQAAARGPISSETTGIILKKNELLADGTRVLHFADHRGGEVLMLQGPRDSVRLKNAEQELLVEQGRPGYFYTRKGSPNEYFHSSPVDGKCVFKMAYPDAAQARPIVEMTVLNETAEEMTAYRLQQFMAQHPEFEALLREQRCRIHTANGDSSGLGEVLHEPMLWQPVASEAVQAPWQ